MGSAWQDRGGGAPEHERDGEWNSGNASNHAPHRGKRRTVSFSAKISGLRGSARIKSDHWLQIWQSPHEPGQTRSSGPEQTVSEARGETDAERAREAWRDVGVAVGVRVV